MSQARQPFVRNHYLPKWLHRLCNASLASVVMSYLLLFVMPWRLALISASAVFFVVLLVDPNRLSFVEGVAGEFGYEDLEEP